MQLTQYIVPPLPVPGDLSGFLSYYQYRKEEPQSSGTSPHRPRFKQMYTDDFRALCYIGDRHLWVLAYSAASMLLGPENRQLSIRLVETWVANNNMRLLAQLYRYLANCGLILT
jgi:hypothetical protein